MIPAQNITGSPQFPAGSSPLKTTSTNEIDSALTMLSATKNIWPGINISERIALLDEIREDMHTVVPEWVEASLRAKEIPRGTAGEGEEWVQAAMIFRLLRLLKKSLTDIREFGKPRYSGPVTVKTTGQAAVKVFPLDWMDRLLYRKVTAEVRLMPELSAVQVREKQAGIYSKAAGPGAICLVLAAGNVSTLSVADFMYKLFVENRVVILKTNPVNAYINPIIEKGFRALISRDYLKIIYGGAAEGALLCDHPDVDEIHLTGSDKTYEAIVFGPGETGQRRKKARQPLITKPFTAELGNVSPVIVVPGPWSETDFKSQGRKLASWLSLNAGFNCLSPRLVILHKSWQDRHHLSHCVGEVLSNVSPRRAYYPGAEDRHAEFLQQHPHALQFGEKSTGKLPWTYVTGVDSDNSEDICFRREAFCSLMAETEIDADTIPGYIDKAVQFANETVWGSLVVSILVHPDSMRDPKIAAAVERAVDTLRYGSVCVNMRGEYAYLLMVTPWGAYPGHDCYDIQSGQGVVNNLLMFEQTQKAVIRGPFAPFPDPVAVTSKRMPEFGRKLTEFEYNNSIAQLPGLLWTAVRGEL